MDWLKSAAASLCLFLPNTMFAQESKGPITIEWGDIATLDFPPDSSRFAFDCKTTASQFPSESSRAFGTLTSKTGISAMGALVLPILETKYRAHSDFYFNYRVAPATIKWEIWFEDQSTKSKLTSAETMLTFAQPGNMTATYFLPESGGGVAISCSWTPFLVSNVR